MPEIIVYAVEGRTAEQKMGLCKDITAAVAKNFAVPEAIVTVQIVEATHENKCKGGKMFSET